jgi:hypothetical protein
MTPFIPVASDAGKKNCYTYMGESLETNFIIC